MEDLNLDKMKRNIEENHTANGENFNQEDRTQFAKYKIVTHVELQVDPHFIDEVISNAIKTKDLILLEEGTEIFRLTRKKEEPNTLVIFAVYTSQEFYGWHLEQVYVKSFFEFLNNKLLEAPNATYLEEI